MVRSDPSLTDFYLHGYSRLTRGVRKFVCITSLSSSVADAASYELLEDARPVRTKDAREQAVGDEFDLITAIGEFTWGRLALVADDAEYPAESLEADVTECAHVQRAFLEKRIFSELRRLPWSRAQGDILGNLQKLKESDAGGLDAGCSEKIRTLMRSLQRSEPGRWCGDATGH